ncbi:MAG: hypothetical protein WD555_04090 [Fulvivirga sp.]
MNFLRIGITNVFYVLSLSSILLACETGTQEVDLKDNEAQRNAVYDQILNDEELFTDFMNSMSRNDQSTTSGQAHEVCVGKAFLIEASLGVLNPLVGINRRFYRFQ